ncbi:MAG: 30S ribosomal protein S8 [Victivallales bacterium]|nr:30S ribosomal protein S8 [Victivallales bacterium]MCF7889199.1 30S ribosomal protein S8 [Victivallales bacterium]
MSMQDPISDMLARIRNAGMASLLETSMPASKMKASIANVLKEEGYIKDYTEKGEGAAKELVIKVKYYKKFPVIEGIKKVSRPSCRIYCGSNEIPRVRNGLGTVVLSTPKGIICGKKAKELNVGGEILCYVW